MGSNNMKQKAVVWLRTIGTRSAKTGLLLNQVMDRVEQDKQDRTTSRSEDSLVDDNTDAERCMIGGDNVG